MIEAQLSADDKRDLADGEWWREICTILGAILIGWTHRSSATISYPPDGRRRIDLNYVELDGRIAQTINHLMKKITND